MWALLGLFAGAVIGKLLFGNWASALFALVGFVVGAIATSRQQRSAAPMPAQGDATRREAQLSSRVADLERRVVLLERALAAAPPAAASERAPDGTTVAPTPAPTLAETIVTRAPTPAPPPLAQPPDAPLAVPVVPPAAPSVSRTAATVPAPEPLAALWRWFQSGDAVTRIGVVVLLFGVAFLLRYFAEHFTIPIEARLLGVAIVALVVVAIGLKLAARRPGYGLSLQALGAGVLYLTAFAAFRLYGVIAATPALVLLVAIAAATVVLALRNDSMALAALACSGGFLAPILVGGSGGPAPLFGYFAVLNGAIFALAWRRDWRPLTALGFVFTFVLGVVWGARFYQPEYFAVVEPFLLLFFAFYTTIAILEAKRAPPAIGNPVHALLVFGVPMVGFALQALLVHETRYGLAWSAFALAAIYAVLWLALHRRDEPGLALLRRAFVALAVIFATLAIPFAFGDAATSALWAVEAAGVYWLGVRQRSALGRAFALVVAAAAGAWFAAQTLPHFGGPMFANSGFIGAMLIALGGFAIAWIGDHAVETLPPIERETPTLAFAWGALWWALAGVVDLHRVLPTLDEPHAMLAWAIGSIALALALSRLLAWRRLASLGAAVFPVLVVATAADLHLERTTLAHYGLLLWPLAWLVQYAALRAWNAAGAAAPLHAASAFALTAQIAWEASEWTGRITSPSTVWVACVAVLPAIAYVALASRISARWRWPFGEFEQAYAMTAAQPIALLVALWFVVVNAVSPGDPSPLPYVPLVNPLDATLALAAASLFAWTRERAPISERARYALVGGALFVVLNGVVLRTGHHWLDIPWQLASLLASKPLQAALTLTWSATALVVMLIATRRALRPLWTVGAALLAVVLVKLFLVDFAALSGLPRVVAFLGVGALLLVIGYVAPLPPARD